MTAPGNTGGEGGQGGQGDGGGSGTGPGTGAPAQQPQQGQGGAGTATPPADDWGDRDDWKGLADELGLTPAQVKEKLGHARTWEQRAKDNRTAAEKAADLETTVTKLREESAARDTRDLERSIRTARTDLTARLVDLGMTRADVADAVADIDSGRLMKDGEPDDKLIEQVATRMAKVAGRVQPDRDQGAAGGGTGGQSTPGRAMDDWVRGQIASRRR